MNENINLLEILEDCPRDYKLYSPIYGDVFFYASESHFIKVKAQLHEETITIFFTKEGKYQNNYGIDNNGGECLLFPSKEQRDWNKFKAPWKPIEVTMDGYLARDGDGVLNLYQIKPVPLEYRWIAKDAPRHYWMELPSGIPQFTNIGWSDKEPTKVEIKITLKK